MSSAPAVSQGIPKHSDKATRAAAGRARIVTAVSGDLDAVIALEHRCFGPTDHFSRKTWRHLLATAAANGTSLTLVVREGALIVATINALLRSNSTTGRIYSIAVDPSQQGRGLARQLVEALVRRLPERIMAVSLEVRTANEGARRLYDRLGMRVVGTMPGHYPDGGDGLRYRASRSAILEALRSAP
jgi:ribosomal protein S18 acetylase RimI-like enzyme